jgi:hypothetical protein
MRLAPDDPRLAALGLPQDREWYRLMARGGIDLPWDVGNKWSRKLDWSAIGTPVDTARAGSVMLLDPSGEPWHLELWSQRIGDPREGLYLEARWYPEERRNRIAMHGLEAKPSDALISSLARARDWFAPIIRTDESA